MTKGKKLIFKPWRIWWWKFIFAPKSNYYDEVKWRTVVLCRMKNHPEGVVWYNVCGLEPNMHCKNCGDDLG